MTFYHNLGTHIDYNGQSLLEDLCYCCAILFISISINPSFGHLALLSEEFLRSLSYFSKRDVTQLFLISDNFNHNAMQQPSFYH